jgi:hypothetical protein
LLAYEGNSIFYNLLRPEFVRHYEKPLCSDAFSGWLSGDPNSQQLNEDVERATAELFKTVIPEFAKKIVLKTLGALSQTRTPSII